MGNTISTKPQQQQQPPPSPPPLAAEGEAEEPETGHFTCEICIDPTLTDKVFRNNGLCAHPFCIDCVTKYIQVKVEHDHIAEIKCPGLNCAHLLDPLTCRTLLRPHTFVKWCDVKCERAVLGLERCYCPNRECSVVVVNECGGRGNVKRSKCPNCKMLFCFRCGIKWHWGFSCEESGEMRDSNDIAFRELARRKNWMRCPGCKHFVELVHGCPIVSAAREFALTDIMGVGHLRT